jgi:hypothetical protein
MSHTTPGHYLSTELIDAKRNGRQFKQPDLAAFIDVNLEAWCQANGYQLVKAPQAAIPSTPSPALSPAEAIYAAYPRKVGKTAAIKSITKALQQIKDECLISVGQTPESFLLEQTKKYALAVSKWASRERQFIPMTTTWFNQGRYLDDPTEWQRCHASSAGPTARDYSKI